MASYETRGKAIRVVVSLGAGKKISGTFDTKADAKKWADEQEKLKAIGKSTAPRGLTVGDLFKAYLPIAEQADSGRENVMRLTHWLGDPLSKAQLDAVITHDIDLWIARRSKEPSKANGNATGKTVKPSTVSRELNLMSGAFTWAVDTRKWIKVNPCHGALRPAKARGRNRKLLTRQEIDAICISSGYVDGSPPETLTAKVGGCFLLALETGMRSGEILRLQPRDYLPENRTVHVRAAERGGRKGARSGRNHADPSRDVPLTERAMQLIDNLLLAMPEDQEAKEGFSEPPYIVGMDDSQRDALWRKVRGRAGVEDLKFHDTKHEAATKLSKFLDVLALSHAIGTKDVRLLRDTYYNNDAQRAAALLPARLAT